MSKGTRREAGRVLCSHSHPASSYAVLPAPPVQGCRVGMAPEALVWVIAPVVG